MQSKVFVFVGLTDRSQTVDMTALQETLNHLTIVPDNAFSLEESTKLLTAMIDDVGYYLSYTSSKKELKDWLQLKEDFELTGNLDPLTKESLSIRFIESKRNRPGRYTNENYLIATKMLEAMSNILTCPIIAFH